MKKSILLAGKPYSSKTIFLTQFYSRLRNGRSKLKLYKTVDDLSPIVGARASLADGQLPEPTAAERAVNFYLPINFNGNHVDLKCPEYGGEQINKIIQKRSLNKSWTDSIKECDNWVLFIRLNSIIKPMDLSDISKTEFVINKGEADSADFQLSGQSFFIELLQFFLQVRKHNHHIPDPKLKLTVVLTCWDEMDTEDKPVDVLAKILPLFSSFIMSSWTPGNIKILGLSALGFALDTNENREKYQIHGPENYGYLVLPDGTQIDDITQLIEQALS